MDKKIALNYLQNFATLEKLSSINVLEENHDNKSFWVGLILCVGLGMMGAAMSNVLFVTEINKLTNIYHGLLPLSIGELTFIFCGAGAFIVFILGYMADKKEFKRNKEKNNTKLGELLSENVSFLESEFADIKPDEIKSLRDFVEMSSLRKKEKEDFLKNNNKFLICCLIGIRDGVSTFMEYKDKINYWTDINNEDIKKEEEIDRKITHYKKAIPTIKIMIQ